MAKRGPYKHKETYLNWKEKVKEWKDKEKI